MEFGLRTSRNIYKLGNGFNCGDCLRHLWTICIFMIILSAGCVVLPSGPPDETNISTPKTCRIIQTDQPVTTQECTNYTQTTTNCDDRPMNYSIIAFSENTLCTTGGSCANELLESCSKCSVAVSRCIMTIKSDEKKETGTITVGANFTLPGGAFIKEPISKTFNHGANHTFDFYQIYNLEKPIITAKCNLYVIGTPTVKECKDITKIESDCKPVTRIEKIQTEVCS